MRGRWDALQTTRDLAHTVTSSLRYGAADLEAPAEEHRRIEHVCHATPDLARCRERIAAVPSRSNRRPAFVPRQPKSAVEVPAGLPDDVPNRANDTPWCAAARRGSSNAVVAYGSGKQRSARDESEKLTREVSRLLHVPNGETNRYAE